MHQETTLSQHDESATKTEERTSLKGDHPPHKSAVNKLKPRDKPYIAYDGEVTGFGVQVFPSGQFIGRAGRRVFVKCPIGSFLALTVDIDLSCCHARISYEEDPMRIIAVVFGATLMLAGETIASHATLEHPSLAGQAAEVADPWTQSSDLLMATNTGVVPKHHPHYHFYKQKYRTPNGTGFSRGGRRR